MLLDKLFGSETAEKVLFYMYVYNEGYGTKIASVYDISLSMVQKQLVKFEEAGVLASKLQGKTRVYIWNPRYPFLNELKSLLEKAYEFIPLEMKEKYYRERKRPRRSGKPL